MKEFELLVSSESPDGPFQSLAQLHTQNAFLPRTPDRLFRFPRVTAKYVTVRVLSCYKTDASSCFIYRIGAYDRPQPEQTKPVMASEPR